MRLFIALWPDAAVRAALAALPLADGRRVLAADLHLTLAFLGEQAPDQIDPLLALCAQLPRPAIDLTIDQLGSFRHGRDVTLWAGPSEVPAPLQALHELCRQALHEIGVGLVEHERFVPHVTLAKRARATSDAPLAPAIRWRAGAAVLVRSRPAGGLPRYQVLTGKGPDTEHARP